MQGDKSVEGREKMLFSVEIGQLGEGKNDNTLKRNAWLIYYFTTLLRSGHTE